MCALFPHDEVGLVQDYFVELVYFQAQVDVVHDDVLHFLGNFVTNVVFVEGKCFQLVLRAFPLPAIETKLRGQGTLTILVLICHRNHFVEVIPQHINHILDTIVILVHVLANEQLLRLLFQLLVHFRGFLLEALRHVGHLHLFVELCPLF